MRRSQHEILGEAGPRTLIYPLDTTFIHELDPSLAKRWINSGWEVEKTIFLVIKYPTIPIDQSVDSSPASDLFAGIIYAWSRQEYYRVVVFTENFFQYTSDLLLKINTWHEKQHVISEENHAHLGTVHLTEEDIVRKEIEFVFKNFGEVGIKTRMANIQASITRLRHTNAIPGDMAVLWLREYVGINYPKYAPLAIPIPPTQYSKNIHRAHNMRIQNCIRVYDMLDEEISELFKYNRKDLTLI